MHDNQGRHGCGNVWTWIREYKILGWSKILALSFRSSKFNGYTSYKFIEVKFNGECLEHYETNL